VTRRGAARDLSYRLYTISERRKWAQETIGNNALVLFASVQRFPEEKKATTPTLGELIQANGKDEL
jgi:hypothetical protein